MKKCLVVFVLIGASLVLNAACQPKGGDSGKSPVQISIQMAEPDQKVLTIGNKDYNFSQVLEKSDENTARNYQRMMEYLFDTKERVVEQFVQNFIFQEEAKKKGMSLSQFMEKVVYGGKIVPDKAKVDLMVERQQGMPRERAEEFVVMQEKRMKEDAYMRQVKTSYPYVVHLEKPLPPPVDIAIGSSPSKGPANAEITLVEFSDFQCPFCARFTDTMKQVMEKYGSKVRRVWKQFPLSFHDKAHLAAEASLCANEQGKFWEYHDKLFETKALEKDGLIKSAADLKLNEPKFKKCLESGKFKATVDKELNEGQKVGVNGTPALFINGVMLSGAQPIEEVSKMIDLVLKKQGKKN